LAADGRLRLAMKALAFGQFRLKRGGKGVKMTFAETMMADAGVRPAASGKSAGSPGAVPVLKDVQDAYTSEQVTQMLSELGQLLDERPGNRAALPHLALIEKQLKKRGGSMVFLRLPVEVVHKSHEQLLLLSSRHDRVVSGLLMQALTQTLAQRKFEIAPQAVQRTPDSGLHSDLRDAANSDVMVVKEGRYSDFFDSDHKR
jgi:hypothetical protein